MLHDNALPERGNIQIEFREKSTDGACGVTASILSLITGAGNEVAFKGIGGHFKRRNKLQFGADISSETRFTRLDTKVTVDISVNLQSIPQSPRIAELLPACLNETASSSERTEFHQLWQARVQAILLDHADDQHVFSVTST